LRGSEGKGVAGGEIKIKIKRRRRRRSRSRSRECREGFGRGERGQGLDRWLGVPYS
jgi:hypothetical protein